MQKGNRSSFNNNRRHNGHSNSPRTINNSPAFFDRKIYQKPDLIERYFYPKISSCIFQNGIIRISLSICFPWLYVTI